MSTTIRVSDRTRERVAALAQRSGKQMQVIVDEAVEHYERGVFWDAFDEAYDRLASNPLQWSEIQSERRCEEGALRDGVT